MWKKNTPSINWGFFEYLKEKQTFLLFLFGWCHLVLAFEPYFACIATRQWFAVSEWETSLRCCRSSRLTVSWLVSHPALVALVFLHFIWTSLFFFAEWPWVDGQLLLVSHNGRLSGPSRWELPDATSKQARHTSLASMLPRSLPVTPTCRGESLACGGGIASANRTRMAERVDGLEGL